MKQCLFICYMIRNNGKSVVCEGNPYIFCLASVDPTSESPASVLSVQLLTEPLLQKKHSPQKVSTFTDTRSPGLPSLQHFPSRSPFLQFMAQDRSRNCFWDRSVFDMDITGTDRGQCDL